MNSMEQEMISRFHVEVSGVAHRACQQIEETAYLYRAPSMVFRPRISMDGDQWCALYGENLQDGVAGFGASPSLAMSAFDLAWETKR